MKQRYKHLINDVNGGILSFNAYLAPKFHVPQLVWETIKADGNCVEVPHGVWKTFSFPNSKNHGVYFLIGFEQSRHEQNGMYVGKASYNSAIGVRMDQHFRPSISKPQYTMNGYNNEVYVLEYAVSINFDAIGIPFMSEACEEFLISHLRSKHRLINGTGN